MSSVSGVVSSLNQTVNGFESDVDVHVSNIHTASVNVQNGTQKIFDEVQKFRNDMEHGEQQQLAHENIIRIDQIIREQYGGYDNIRRTVMGVVRDFDINLVRNSIIKELSEELWITGSRYWLSYALIAIQSWVNDFKEVARNAVSECIRRDPVKASLFFTLLNLRFDRVDAAKKWFSEYLKTLDPTKLQPETAIMIQSFLSGIFGKDREMEENVKDVIKGWIDVINQDADISGELVDEYSEYLDNLDPQADFPYENIKLYCVNSQQVAQSFNDVTKFDLLLFLLDQLDVEMEEQNTENYKARVDAVLVDLISDYDKEELELRNQQEYFNLVMANKGEVDVAERQYEAEMALQDDSFNIGKQMVKWAIYDDSEMTDVHVRRFAFLNTKNWFENALEKFTSGVKEKLPLNFELQIDTWSGSTNGADGNEAMESLKNHLETNKFHNCCINDINILCLIIVAVAAGLCFVTIYALVAVAAAGAVLAYRIYAALSKYPGRVKADYTALRDTLAEIADFQQYYQENLAKKDEVVSKAEFI
jgi:hypothetical protein